MAYNDETVSAKLASLNDTADAITGIASWVMFHRRQAKRTAEIWLDRLRDANSQKRLNLIYLANEVAQQSKIRAKLDFIDAFSPIIAQAMGLAYRDNSTDIKRRIQHVAEVWRQRNVFNTLTLDEIDAAIASNQTNTSGPLKGGLGGFKGGSSGIPSELSKVVSAHQAVAAKVSVSTANLSNALSEYRQHMEADINPALPVWAARLSGLVKTLDNANASIQDAITARRELINNLERVLESAKTALIGEEAQVRDLTTKRDLTEAKKSSVEAEILSGLSRKSPELGPGGFRSTTPPTPENRPEASPLSPPPLTEHPNNSEADAASLGLYDATPMPSYGSMPFESGSPIQGTHPGNGPFASGSPFSNGSSANLMLSSVMTGLTKSNGMEDDMNAGLEDLDDDIAEMFRKDSTTASR